MSLYCCFLVCFVGTILTINQSDASQNIIHADQYVVWNQKLVGCAFWSLPVSDVGTCASSCLRVTKCNSFNYDLSTKFCDMNDHTHADKGHSLTRVVGVIYSEIAKWPQELDPDCYSRSCGEDDVCVPREVFQFIKGTEDCSTYGCMKFRASRTGSTTASTPSPSTPTSLGMVCSNDSECLQKNSRCVSYNRQKNKRWRCLCNHHTEYDAATRSCETRCTNYSDTFTTKENTRIKGYNLETINTISLEGCKQKCIEYGQTCASVDYRTTNRQCNLNNVTYQQVMDGDPSRLEDKKAHYDLYTRDCTMD